LKILVTGLLPYDSGKTEFILSLLEIIKDYGYSAGYFKPVGGHDGWYQYDTLIHSMDLGVLVGHDAYIVSEKLGLLDKIHVISPLDLLTFPIDPVKPGLSVRAYVEYMESTARRTVLARYTRILGRGIHSFKNIYFICMDAVNRLNKDLQEVFNDLLDSLKNESSIFINTRTTHVENLLSSPVLYSVIDQNLGLLDNYDPLIIEGYNDVSAPTIGSLNVDYVFIIAPGKVLAYSGERYRMAVQILSYRGFPWMIKVSNLIELLGKPLLSKDIPIKTYVNKYRGVFEEVVEFILENRFR